MRITLAGITLALVLCHARDAAGASTAPAPVATSGTAAPGPAATPRARAASGASGRTLDTIHIEGEIAVPQVLFITARDQRRFMDFQHRRYLRTSLQLGAAVTPPSRITFTPPPTPDGRKENHR